MMSYEQQVAQQQEEMRRQQEQEMVRQEEERRRREEQQRTAAMQQQQQASPQQGGIDPGMAMQMYSAFGGGGSAAGGTAVAGGGGAAAGGASGASGAAAGGMSLWPVAVAAGIVAHHQWAKRKGMHTDKDAITGRALYKDGDWYQEHGNKKLDGLGDDVKLASLGSSPLDLFKKETWSDAIKIARQGGIVGKALKKIF